MIIQDVPRKAWADFLNRFCRRYQGWPVSLETSGSSQAVLKTPCLPLEDIEVKSSRDGDQATILIFLGKTCFNHWLSHIIVAPMRVLLEQADGNAWQSLTIHSATGAVTTLRWQAQALPQQVKHGWKQADSKEVVAELR